MFKSLGDALKNTIDKIGGRGKLSEDDVRAAAREIRIALLGADVNVNVVRAFVDAVAERAVGEKVLNSITPEQQFTKIVFDELVSALGGEPVPFDFAAKPPLKVLMVGLQGSGKTTTAARFALFAKKSGRRPFLVPADIHRPAAIEQLKVLARQIGVDCFDTDPKNSADKVASAALDHARTVGYDTVIFDTAGRLHIDEEMMNEVKLIARNIEPQRILYVADSMTGQDAVRQASAFNEALPITGIVLTKLDGDARGGAALSIRNVTGKPIIFAGTGEKIEDLEQFYPERMASRILGKGDIVSLVEKVAEAVDEEDAAKTAESFFKNKFNFEEYLKQLKMIKKMGPLEKMLSLMPGVGNVMKDQDPAELEAALKKREAIVQSMTHQERKTPKILNGSRRRRIAAGAGVEVSDINRFVKEFEAMEKMMKNFSRGGALKKLFKGLTKQAFF